MIRYAANEQCRMSTLVRHFGDLADGQNACGICDFCAPAECAAQRFRPAAAAERAAASNVLKELRSSGTKSTGRMHAQLYPSGNMTRDAFEQVLGAMARAGMICVTDAVFEKDQKQIPYRTVSLKRDALVLNESAPVDFVMKEIGAAAELPHQKRSVTSVSRKKRGKQKRETERKPRIEATVSEIEPRIEQALRAWRLAEAKRRGVPAFRIFSDRVLTAMVSERPGTATDLLAISGVGIKMVEKYGAQIFRILRDTPG